MISGAGVPFWKSHSGMGLGQQPDSGFVLFLSGNLLVRQRVLGFQGLGFQSHLGVGRTRGICGE